MPRRARERRTNSLDHLAARVDAMAGGPCRAVVIEHAEQPGKVFMHLMPCAGPCAICTDARARLWRPPVTRPVAMTTEADEEDAP
jgi:hypothetical protein